MSRKNDDNSKIKVKLKKVVTLVALVLPNVETAKESQNSIHQLFC
jgi:hypothetical protein